jgi:hypothetical protein
MLGASVLGLPWSDGDETIDDVGGVPIGPAGRVMMRAFVELLKLWVSRLSPKASTQVSEAFSQLRAYYLESPASFSITEIGSSKTMHGQSGPDESDLEGQRDLMSRRGFRVMSGGTTTTDRFGDTHSENGVLQYVDLIPPVLKKHMTWTEATRREVLCTLRDRGPLETSKKDELTHTRKVDEQFLNVIRIKAGFFGDKCEDRIQVEHSSRPDELRVLALEPRPASSAVIAAARPLRHDALKVELACLPEHDRALGCEPLAEHASFDAGHKPHERLAPRLDGPLAHVVTVEPQKVEGNQRSLGPAVACHERMEVASTVLSDRHGLAVDQRLGAAEAANRLGDPCKAIREVRAASGPDFDSLALLEG